MRIVRRIAIQSDKVWHVVRIYAIYRATLVGVEYAHEIDRYFPML